MVGDLELFVACLPGLEEILAGECAALDAKPERAEVGSGGATVRGDEATVARLLVGTACSSHVLIRLATFHALHFNELCKKAATIDWRRWLDARVPIVVRASAQRSKLHHTGALAERIEKVVRDRVGTADDAEGEAVTLLVRMQDDRCTLSIDTAGRPLHQRGWRLETAKAPLREDIAAALLRAAGFAGDRPLVDPMCGAGTIAIEAASLARRLPPGLERGFAGERLLGLGPGLITAARTALLGRALDRAPSTLFASDRDMGAVACATRNAERAGVLADIRFDCASLSDAPGLRTGATRGLVACNPPFGVRIGTDARLGNLWQSLGARVRALGPGWRLAVIAADRRNALRSGIDLRSAFLTNHGGIRVRALVGALEGAEGNDDATP